MQIFDSPQAVIPAPRAPGPSERSRAIRILHITGTLNRGGVETWLSQVLIRLPRERYQCDVCTYRFEEGTYVSALKDYGCRSHFVPLSYTPVGLLRFGRDLKRLLRQGDYDIVHTHGLLFVGFVMLIAKFAKIRVRIAHAHNTYKTTEGRFASIVTPLWLRLNRILACTFSTRGIGCSEEAQEALFGLTSRGKPKYSIVHCGIDLTRFESSADRHSLREELGIKAGVRVIGHVSNLGAAKNPRFLIDVAEYVFHRSSEVVLLIVGGGILVAELERICEERGIRSRVIFVGIRSDVPDLMRSAMDIFVMPSVHEGLPLVLLEAQAAGLLCLASDAITREALVGENTVQFLPLSAGVAGWGDQILPLLESTSPPSTALETMKETDFNIAVSAQRLAELYDTCAS